MIKSPVMRLNLRSKIILSMALVAFMVAAAITLTDMRLRRKELLGEFQSFVRSVDRNHRHFHCR